jgi:hypothetical protein
MWPTIAISGFALFVVGFMIASGFTSVHLAPQNSVRALSGNTELELTDTVTVTTGLPTGFTTATLGVVSAEAKGLTAGAYIAWIENNVNGGSGPSAAWGFQSGVGTGSVTWTTISGYISGTANSLIPLGTPFMQIGPDEWEPICEQNPDGQWICI